MPETLRNTESRENILTRNDSFDMALDMLQSQEEIAAYDRELHELLKGKNISGLKKTDANGDDLTFDVTYSGLGFVIQVIRVNRVTKDKDKKSEHVLETTTRTRIEIQKEGAIWTLKSYPSAVTVKFEKGQEKERRYPPSKPATVREVIDALKAQ